VADHLEDFAMRWTLPLAAMLIAVAASACATSPDKPSCYAADANRDGVISREEAQSIPRLAGQFDTADANKDGQIDAAEMEAYRTTVRTEARSRAQARWKAADKDGDGALSRAEAEASMPRLAENFDRFDANGDGRLERSEMHDFRKSHERHRCHNTQ
jgi:Ca2+-binding EF-hand superfamily protein